MRSIVVLLVCCITSFAQADTIAVIGTGSVAKALGPEFALQGHTIVYGSRSPKSNKSQALLAETSGNASIRLPAAAAALADIVVMAVPGLMVEEITESLGDLSGKIIIDPTNPLVGDWESRLSLGVATSNAAIIQNAAPDAFVVKAFSSLNWQEMVEPNGPISILIAGNNAEAKARVAALVRGMDLEPIDLGDVNDAHWIEGMTILWLNNRISDRPDFEFHLRTID